MIDLKSLNNILAFNAAQRSKTDQDPLQEHPSERLSRLDTLTRVYHREHFELELGNYWRRATKEKTAVALFLAGVDQFSGYNEKYGTRSGDYELQKIARTLKNLFRRGTDVVARYGEDKFIILAINMTPEQVRHHAQLVCTRIHSLKIKHEASVSSYLSVSAGYAFHQPHNFKELHNVLGELEQQLMLAKQNGGNTTAGNVA